MMAKDVILKGRILRNRSLDYATGEAVLQSPSPLRDMTDQVLGWDIGGRASQAGARRGRRIVAALQVPCALCRASTCCVRR